MEFQPIENFTWETNRAERSLQVHLLGPLLSSYKGRKWFLNQIRCTSDASQAHRAEVFHLCFPLRDIFFEDFKRCRSNPIKEDQFIAYYNQLFDLPPGFGVQEVWRTAPSGEIRHPGAGGRAGWYDDFLRKRIKDPNLFKQARNVRRILGTEADIFILTKGYAIIVECKYHGKLSMEQYQRHITMGRTLAKRLSRKFHFGLVVQNSRDSDHAIIKDPYVLWSTISEKLNKLK